MGKLKEDFQDLFHFVITGNLALAQLQLKEYTDVNFKNSSNSTLLITTCRSEANEKDIHSFVEFLLKKGTYIMKKNSSGRTTVDYCEQTNCYKLRCYFVKL
ncbi:Hypothetical predicted protein [Mytilus galloprovincialis]|uniref:Uncharacterized protein n=1 Tax=Mytilus galloprovincialis TaxID=29158 RepID=A0A8B6EI47_MYTGA|nr:Hypothetical predicted protein [Mytilus galloprovincialis]